MSKPYKTLFRKDFTELAVMVEKDGQPVIFTVPIRERNAKKLRDYFHARNES